jgi:acyl-CoA dehydrogenase
LIVQPSTFDRSAFGNTAMDFGLSEEQELLQQSARDFLARECPPAFVREMMATPDGVSRSLHEKTAALGWNGLVVPESYGGQGLGMLDRNCGCRALPAARALAPWLFSNTATVSTPRASRRSTRVRETVTGSTERSCS